MPVKKIFEDRNLKESFVYFIIYCVNKIFCFQVLNIITLKPKDLAPVSEKNAPNFTSLLLSPEAVKNYERDADKLPDHFLAEASEKKDFCQTYLNETDTKIISFGWYALCATRIDDNFTFRFSDRYLYMYHGYTEPAYRGYRLHGAGMAKACREAAKLGKEGLISFVYAINYRSLRSCARLNYRTVGYVFTFILFGYRFALSSPGALKHGVRLSVNKIAEKSPDKD